MASLTEKQRRFLAENAPQTPCLVVDLDVVAERYTQLQDALPLAEIFYAIKANPAPEILTMLTRLGSRFDTASVYEIDMCLSAGARPEHISYGNTIKKHADIKAAYERGVRLFAYDSVEEMDKLADAAPGSHVFCRILTSGAGADWPLSRKFGCEPAMAYDLLKKSADKGLVPYGLSFHVGSQQRDLTQWDAAVAEAAQVYNRLVDEGYPMGLINLGGGFPCTYQTNVPGVDAYGKAIMGAMTTHFGNRLPRMIIEPGRYMAGDAGVLQSEVVLVSRKSDTDDRRWVYLDIGKFGGLAETMDEAIRYRMVTPRDGDAEGPVVIAGPTCDSADVLYDKAGYTLPLSLKAGDKVMLMSTGAYTTTYAAVGFNGFPPLKAYYI